MLTNTGVIQAGYDAVPGFGIPVASTTFAHLGAFNNGTSTGKGVVTMINGTAGDVLTVSGLFTGAAGHSVLALDAYLGGDGSIARRCSPGSHAGGVFNGAPPSAPR